MPSLPSWARWSPVGADRPWTVGIEEEVMLLEPHGWTLVNRVDDVLASLPPEVRGRASAETHACAVELASRPHAQVAAAATDLARLRRSLQSTLDGLGLRAAVAGTHPSAVWSEVEASSGPRYQRIRASMRDLVRREPTFALHVHVAVPDGEAAARALDGMRRDLPLLLALSANSPYWQGRDTGLTSVRTPIFSMFPRVGIPRAFGSYGAYVDAVEAVVACRAVPDPSFLWWDARLRPHLATVEIRIMDAQTRVAQTAALAALVQCLVRLHAEGPARSEAPTPEALAENRFLAARDGISARLIAPDRPRMQPALVRLGELLEACRPLAAALGCSAELQGVARVAEHPGHARQRSIGQQRGLPGLTAALAGDFAARGGASGAEDLALLRRELLVGQDALVVERS
jgi:glutamate---cysteine ligase / carboxylate-amine ligase